MLPRISTPNDEYGRPGSSNAEFLQYTGQLAIASAPGVYNYRNRFYQADIGRFLQTDPIGYGAGLNLYAYVGNDPINRIDPWGLDDDEIVVEGRRPRLPAITIVLPHVLIDDVGTAVTDADHEIVVLGIRRRRGESSMPDWYIPPQEMTLEARQCRALTQRILEIDATLTGPQGVNYQIRKIETSRTWINYLTGAGVVSDLVVADTQGSLSTPSVFRSGGAYFGNYFVGHMLESALADWQATKETLTGQLGYLAGQCDALGC